MAQNSILFHHYFCLSFWGCYCPHCEKMCGTISLTNTKGTVSVLWPHPPAWSTCPQELHRWDLLFNASFQSRKPWRHFPFINQNQGPQKSVGFLLSNHTALVWIVWYKFPPLGICYSETRCAKMLLEEDCLCSCCQTEKQWELCSRQARKALNFIPLYCPICVGFSPSLIVI